MPEMSGETAVDFWRMNLFGNDVDPEGCMKAVTQVDHGGMQACFLDRVLKMQVFLVDRDSVGEKKFGNMHGRYRTEHLSALANPDRDPENKIVHLLGYNRKLVTVLLGFFPNLFLPDFKGGQFFLAGQDAQVPWQEKVSCITGRNRNKISGQSKFFVILFQNYSRFSHTISVVKS